MAGNDFNNRGRSSQGKSFNRGFSSSNSFGRDGRTIRNNDRNNDKQYSKQNNDSNRKNSRNKFDRDNYSKDGYKKNFSDKKYGSEKPYGKNNNHRDSFAKPKRGEGRKKEYDKSYNKDDRYENKHMVEPAFPYEINPSDLDSAARAQLRGLRKEVADNVAKHLIFAGQIIDVTPEEALAHVNFALKCASRVPIVREAMALCSYQCENFAQTLRELRAYERLTGKKTLPSIEADCLRATGKINQAVELISGLNMKALDIAEQVEVIIVSASIRSDMGQPTLGINILDNTLASPHVEENLKYRLLEAKANLLEQMGESEKAQKILDELPQEESEIFDLDEYTEGENTSGLRGSDIPLSTLYDLALFDLDGVCFRGMQPVENASNGINEARENGMNIRFVTNNASKTQEQVAEKLQSFDIQADKDEVMTAAMDIAHIMVEQLPEGAKVLVIGGTGLRKPISEAGFEIVESYKDQPEAVVQGFDQSITWEDLTQAAYSIENGAQYFASNIDSTLPTEHGMALGNGSLVAAVQHATGKKPISGGKPFPGIFARAVQTCADAKYPIAIGDRLGTDIAGAKAAGYPSMHVLTGVNDARDVAFASVENRPTYLAIDITGLAKTHPYPVLDDNGYYVCDDSAKVRVIDDGLVEIDGEILEEETTISLNTYRSYVAAIWDAKDNRGIRVDSPKINVVNTID
ncbi:HAD-IIA family hydrolase [Actinomyces sp. zg-332]|uniref:HAD-IIA family hydrolase n=1 Tax=Actinomyces sp. zg-332 TaxID=2708340 RepID=UPI00141D9722|nr:HAD-IIA family hydrolase [Actinomyces sp. zg-332]QPK93737.1 HAD-IIA family hydrolase [Actinomyces sp. zg-332]